MSALLELARRTADARLRRDVLKAELADRRAEFEASIADITETHKLASADAETCENELRALALAAYTSDPTNKKPAPGVSVAMEKVISYDPLVALVWAQNTKLALLPERLDEKAFLAIARATDLPFVTLSERPSIKLATDLNAALVPVGV